MSSGPVLPIDFTRFGGQHGTREFQDPDSGLIRLAASNSIADRYSVGREQDGTAYQVPGGSTLRIEGLMLINSVSSVEGAATIQYQDNNIGDDSAGAGTTPVRAYTTVSAVSPHIACPANANGNGGIASIPFYFEVPATKFVGVRLLSSTELVCYLWGRLI